MSFWGNKYARASKWFEWFLLLAGVLIIVVSFIKQFVAGMIIGCVPVFLWTISLGVHNGSLLQKLERKYVKSCMDEEKMIVDKKLVVKLTLLSLLPMYFAFTFPSMLLPFGGLYALSFFVPLFIAFCAQFTVIYRRWEALEIKPNFFWPMQIGIFLFISTLSILAYFLGLYGPI